MTAAAKISIITPVYNVESYIGDAIESVLNQSHENFELLLVNDCSTDNSLAVMERFAAKDDRIHVLKTPVNSWAHAAANVALEYATGDYVAMLDGDDILPLDRLETQVRFLERYPGIDVCGGWVQLFGKSNKKIASMKLDDFNIRAGMLFDTSLAHGTVMIRRSVIEKHMIRYNTDIYYAHDYDLLMRLAFDCNARFANLPKVLYLSRVHGGQASNLYRDKQLEFADRVRREVLERFGITDPELVRIHLCFARKRPGNYLGDMSRIYDYIDALFKANKERGFFPQQQFEHYLADKICRDMHRCGLISALSFYYNCPFKDKLDWNLGDMISFLLKSLRRRPQPNSEGRSPSLSENM